MRSMPLLALSKYSFEPLGWRLTSLGGDMRRRRFITLLGGAAVALPMAVHAQEPVKMLRVGAVSGHSRLKANRILTDRAHPYGGQFELESRRWCNQRRFFRKTG